jgi:transcription initiation factor TFIIB
MDQDWDVFDTFNKQEEKKIQCANCGENSDVNDYVENDGYIICTKCGLVVSNRISDNAEWNNYVGGKSNSRCGTSIKTTEINPFANEMSSFMPKGVKNLCIKDGKIIKYDISRIHIQSTFNHLQKSFSQVENLLDNITNDKYSKRVVITAKTLWGEIMEAKKITRAGVRKGMIACCLYYACINHDCTRSPIEICNDFGMSDTKQFNKGDKEFKETFENIPKWSYLLVKTSKSDDYFGRFCSSLEMDHLIKEGTSFALSKECREIFDKIENNLIGLFPKSSACGIIYWVLKNKKIPITKTKISKSLGVCNPTLSKTVKIIEKILGKP